MDLWLFEVKTITYILMLTMVRIKNQINLMKLCERMNLQSEVNIDHSYISVQKHEHTYCILSHLCTAIKVNIYQDDYENQHNILVQTLT